MRTKNSGTPSGRALFSDLGEEVRQGAVSSTSTNSDQVFARWESDPFSPLLEILNRTKDLNSPTAIFRLFVGQSEVALGSEMMNGAAEAWRNARVLHDLQLEEVGEVAALPSAFKLLFNYYFRDDLYGRWIHNEPIVLSSGSFDEEHFGLPKTLKTCIEFAVSNNWYGYSDSLGRIQTREALAELECQLNSGGSSCTVGQIAITMGATAAISSIADCIAGGRTRASLRALCGIPNYVPLVASVSRAFSTSLVATPLKGNAVDITEMIERVRSGVDFVLLQTVSNPWGVGVARHQLQHLIDSAPAGCTIVLDMCHEHFGASEKNSPSRLLPLLGARGAAVVSVRSLSKQWAAPGLKCGWIRAPEPFISAFYEHASTTYGGPPSVFSLLLEVYARFEALRLQSKSNATELTSTFPRECGLSLDNLQRGFDCYLREHECFTGRVKHNRRLACEQLADAGIEVVSPDYSINLFCRYGALPDYATYRQLIADFNVSVFPGSLCMLPGDGMFRISPCLAPDALERAISRIQTWATGAPFRNK